MSKGFFCIAGAQRSGTTYLYNILDQHTEICMAKPAKPEPKFFLDENEFVKGKEYYLATYYAGMRDYQIPGEKSTSYIESGDAANRIKQMFPKAKIIFLLRNPVYRAVSNYSFSRQNNLERRSMEEVFLDQKSQTNVAKTSVSPYSYVERGEYARYLETYWSVFGRKNIHIVLFEELVAELETINRIFQFLEVEPMRSVRDLNEKVNASEPTGNVPANVMSFLREHFKPHNQHLSDLLGRNVSEWWTI